MPDAIKNLTASFHSLALQAVTNRLKDLHTAMPGIIVSFDAATQLAEVQPAIKRLFNTGDSNEEILVPADLPILIKVPCIFPQGGGFSLTFPIAPGDECLLIIAERSIDNWHEFGGTQEPQAWRMHSLSDATAIVGINSKPKKIQNFDPNNVQLRDADATTNVTIKPGNLIDINAPVKLTVTAPDTDWVGDINHTGDLTTSGTIKGQTDVLSGSSEISGKGHTHPGDSGGTTGPPNP